ncbi:unnamed protein product [Prorocentrum cordatum]|uniref:ACB domain-containing protein n=1 Tax=Prorocentrum cordatum TaxID=2364126 RepID=A0ABN9SWD9_9DINO|nr:unnamed protein product [Polarella glacialis]
MAAPARSSADDERAFEAAAEWVRSPAAKGLSSADKAHLHLKQARDGDCTGTRPKGQEARRKWDAWGRQRGASREEARARYLALLDELEPSWRSTLRAADVADAGPHQEGPRESGGSELDSRLARVRRTAEAGATFESEPAQSVADVRSEAQAACDEEAVSCRGSVRSIGADVFGSPRLGEGSPGAAAGRGASAPSAEGHASSGPEAKPRVAALPVPQAAEPDPPVEEWAAAPAAPGVPSAPAASRGASSSEDPLPALVIEGLDDDVAKAGRGPVQYSLTGPLRAERAAHGEGEGGSMPHRYSIMSSPSQTSPGNIEVSVDTSSSPGIIEQFESNWANAGSAAGANTLGPKAVVEESEWAGLADSSDEEAHAAQASGMGRPASGPGSSGVQADVVPKAVVVEESEWAGLADSSDEEAQAAQAPGTGRPASGPGSSGVQADVVPKAVVVEAVVVHKAVVEEESEWAGLAEVSSDEEAQAARASGVGRRANGLGAVMEEESEWADLADSSDEEPPAAKASGGRQANGPGAMVEEESEWAGLEDSSDEEAHAARASGTGRRASGPSSSGVQASSQDSADLSVPREPREARSAQAPSTSNGDAAVDMDLAGRPIVQVPQSRPGGSSFGGAASPFLSVLSCLVLLGVLVAIAPRHNHHGAGSPTPALRPATAPAPAPSAAPSPQPPEAPAPAAPDPAATVPTPAPVAPSGDGHTGWKLEAEVQQMRRALGEARRMREQVATDASAESERLRDTRAKLAGARQEVAQTSQDSADYRARCEVIQRALAAGPGALWPRVDGLPHQRCLAVAAGLLGALGTVGPSTARCCFQGLAGLLTFGCLLVVSICYAEALAGLEGLSAESSWPAVHVYSS